MIAGADWFKGRWIVALEDDGGSARLEIAASLRELVERPGLRAALIDVPIGLPERGPRQCDVLARRFIGPRRSSVFPAPLRSMLGAASYKEACARRYAVEGKKCSRQLFGILPLVENVDDTIDPPLQDRVREGHPEVSFTAMAGQPIDSYKGTPAGWMERMNALRTHFPDLEGIIDRLGLPAATIDALDALSLLWSARRLIRGENEIFPALAEVDARGLRMEIVY